MTKYKEAIIELLGKDWASSDDNLNVYISKVEIRSWASKHFQTITDALCIADEVTKDKL